MEIPKCLNKDHCASNGCEVMSELIQEMNDLASDPEKYFRMHQNLRILELMNFLARSDSCPVSNAIILRANELLNEHSPGDIE